MKFNKKLLSLLLVTLFAIVLVGCDGVETTTEAPTTEAPTTQAPTTEAPTTQAPTTQAPTTQAPTTQAPTTQAPTTQAPTTEAPTTAAPVDFQPAIDHLETEYADTLESETFEAIDDLTLIGSFGDFTFTWSSNNTDYVTDDGMVTRPLLTVGDQTVILTATIEKDSQTTTKDFFVTVKALEVKTAAEIAEEVFLYVFAIPSQDFWTSADTLNLVANGEDLDENVYAVTWSSSHPEYVSTAGVITQPEGADVDVTLTATITVDGTEFTDTLELTVAKMAEGTEVATIAAAIALGEDAYVEITGVTVVAMYDNGDVFFTDGTDILYIYSTSFEAVVGNVYDITGLFAFHYNAPQLVGSDEFPLRAADSTAAVTSAPSVVAAGINDIISATSVPTTENPHNYIQYEVTASVYFEESWGNYSVFLVPSDYDFDAPLASGATQPNGDAIMIYYKSDMDVLKAFHGQEITIDVIMQGYRTDKSVFYANFFGTSEDVQLSFSNDADAVEAALGLVNFPYSVVENETFDLVTDMYGVTIAYTTSNSTVFNTTTGAIDVSTLTVQETITVTATATKGTETDTKTISIKVGPLPTSDISTVLALPNTDLAKIEGTIVAGGYHGLFFIQDGTDNIALYFDSYSDDYDTWMALLESNVGNVMEITGEVDSYNGLHQLRVSDATFVSAGTAVTATNIDGLTLDEAGLLAHQGELVELTDMVIIDVYEDNYGNYEFMLQRISDGEEILLRWDSRYDLPTALMTEVETLEVGDKVTVTAVLSWYYDPQLLLVTTTDFTVDTLTDQEALDLDLVDFPDTLTLTEDLPITDGMYGTTYELIDIFGNASNYIDATTTVGTLTVTQPYGFDTTAVMTVKATNGTAEEVRTIDVTVKAISISSLTSDLLISEYGEGSGNNKWIEIYNGTGADVDLSNYSIEYYNNGATAVTQTFVLSGTLADGDVYIMTTNQASQAVQDLADEVFPYPSVVHFNGDDAVALLNGTDIIDVIGVIGEDPGDNWVVGDGATSEYTLVRIPSVLAPNTTFTAAEWGVNPQDYIADLGSHTVDSVVLDDQVMVEVDKAELDENAYIYSAQDVTLPTTGTNGSAITWTILTDEGSNASLAGNVLTLGTVAEYTTAEVVVEATFTLNAVTETATYTFILVGETDADKLAQDKAELEALELGGDAYADVSVSLPITGTKGSTISWAITTDDDSLAAYTEPDLTIARAEGTASVVILTATITKGTATDTLVVTYNMNPEFTDFTELHAQTTPGTWDIPNDTTVVVQGVVTGFGYNLVYIQDSLGNGLALYKAEGFENDGTVNIGDEVVYSGDLDDYPGTRQIAFGATLISTLSTGNSIIEIPFTLDELMNITLQDAGKVITVSGLIVQEYASKYSFTVTGTSGTMVVEMYSEDATSWLPSIYNVGDTLPEVTFIFNKFSSGNIRIELLDVPMTDAQAVQLDAADVPALLELSEDFDIPTSEYGSTFTVTGITGDAAANIDYTTTPGTLLVTQPAIGNPDLTGVITVEVAKGTETTTITVNVTVLAEVAALNITELFISEYAEGSSSNKYMEIYNGTGADIDLSLYTLELYSNGSLTVSESLDLTGTLVAGDVLIIANSSADQTILDEADYALSWPSVPNWNGNDVVTLSKDGAIIDIIGVIGDDTDFAKDVTLVRNSDVAGPNTTYTLSEWTVNAQDDWTNIGTHTADFETVIITELFISEYAEGSSSNKYLEIYNGTGADIDLTLYSAELYSNGSLTVSESLDLTGTLVAGDVLIIANSSADQTILDEADYALSWPSVPNWNGNDVVTLSKDGAIIDIIGVIGDDTDFAKDVTLVRNSDVAGPNTTYTLSEWTVNAQDDWTDIGTHTTD